MKRKLLTLCAGLFAAAGAHAQLADGSVAPDFTVKDINGTSYNLYTLLSSGKTVFLDVSAAWCAPCWNYHHTVHALEDLWTAHGPTGATGVSASTTNDVMIIMVEGESTNTRAQLTGTSSGTAHATFSQGDWVAGTNYPIVDTAILNTPYSINYFPTIYMVCRDHLIREVGQLSTAALYAASQANCPTYAPSSTVDAKAVPYSGADYFFCNATPTVKFQNYSTQTLTSATLKLYSGTTVLATVPWTGSLAPYAVASVAIPSTAGTSFTNYKFDVTATGDSQPSNNMTKDSMFHVYAGANAVTTPWSENFETSTTLPFKMSANGDAYAFQSSGSYVVTGSNGSTSRALLFGFPEVSAGTTMEVVLGNFNTGSATNVALDFDLSHANASGKTDKLEIMVSKDCGTTWATAWSKSGAALGTAPAPAANTAFVPTAASMWRHESALLTSYKNSNMIVKAVGTSNAGHYAFMDNLKMTNTLSVNNVIASNSVNVYPNPAKESATLDFTLAKSGKVVVNILDAIGRTVSVIANSDMQQGAQHISISTATLAAGVYNISIQTEEGVLTQRLSVVK